MKRVTAITAAYSGSILFMTGACKDWTGASLQQKHLAMFNDAELRVIPHARHDVIWDNPSASLNVNRIFLSERN